MEPIIYKMTGGLTHLLGGLLTCIKAAKVTGRDVWIDRSYDYTSFPFSLSEFFDFSAVGVSVEDVVLPLDHPCYGAAAFVGDTAEVGLYGGGRIESKSQSWSGFDIAWEENGVYSKSNTEYPMEYRGTTNAPPDISDDHWKLPHVWHSGGCFNGLPEKMKLQKHVKDECLAQIPQGSYICLHYRNTDAKTNPHLLYEFISELQPTMPVFLCTDHLESVQEIKNGLCKYDVDVRCINEPPKVEYSLHYYHPDKREQILTALKDLCIMRYAEVLWPSFSLAFPGPLGMKRGRFSKEEMAFIEDNLDIGSNQKLGEESGRLLHRFSCKDIYNPDLNFICECSPGCSGMMRWTHKMRINQDHDLFFDHKLE